MKILTRAACWRLAGLGVVLLLLAVAAWWIMIRMPGERYRGPRPAADPALVAELRRDVGHLAGDIGERNLFRPEALSDAARWIEEDLARAGYAPARQVFHVGEASCSNLVAERKGGPEIVVVGAHYDSVPGSPAANDNASGVAATLALARRFAARAPARTLRFLFFVNEEPPWFQTEHMGSLQYARRCRERGEDVVAMLSLETLGWYTDAPGSQRYPFAPLAWAYGDRGDYVGFIGNVASRGLVREAIAVFRAHARIPSEGAAMPELLRGVGWSDQWSFWQCGYPGIMVTDTAPYRYPAYHLPSDTPERLDYEGLALAVEGLEPVVAALARVP